MTVGYLNQIVSIKAFSQKTDRHLTNDDCLFQIRSQEDDAWFFSVENRRPAAVDV